MSGPIRGLNRQKRSAEMAVFIGTLMFVPAFLAVVFGITLAIAFAVAGLVLIIVGGMRLSRMLYDVKRGMLFHWLAPRGIAFTFDPHHGLSPTQLATYAQLKSGQRTWRKNMIIGDMASVPFVSSDVIIDTEQPDRFAGRIYVFAFPHAFKQRLVCTPKTTNGDGGTASDDTTARTVFSEHFTVRPIHERFISHLFTPHVTDTVIRLHNLNRGNVSLTVHDDKLTVIINKKRVLRFQLFKPLDESLFHSLQQDIVFIKRLIEDIKGNDSLFVKEKPTLR